MGLIDPDSTAQVFDGFQAKVAAGQYAMVPFNWAGFGTTDVEDFEGYHSVWPRSAAVVKYGPYVTGAEWRMGVSSLCKNPDRALEFLNWFYSREGILTFNRGPEGELWEMEDGKGVYTDKYFDDEVSAEGYTLEGGGTWFALMDLINANPVSDWTLDPETNQPYRLWNMDLEAREERVTSYMRDSWREHFGDYRDMYSYCLENAPEMLTEKSNKLGFIPSPSDEMTAQASQIGNLVRETSWKMVFAQNQEEFDALWEQLKADAEVLGMADVLADALARHETGVADAEALGIE